MTLLLGLVIPTRFPNRASVQRMAPASGNGPPVRYVHRRKLGKHSLVCGL